MAILPGCGKQFSRNDTDAFYVGFPGKNHCIDIFREFHPEDKASFGSCNFCSCPRLLPSPSLSQGGEESSLPLGRTHPLPRPSRNSARQQRKRAGSQPCGHGSKELPGSRSPLVRLPGRMDHHSLCHLVAPWSQHPHGTRRLPDRLRPPREGSLRPFSLAPLVHGSRPEGSSFPPSPPRHQLTAPVLPVLLPGELSPSRSAPAAPFVQPRERPPYGLTLLPSVP